MSLNDKITELENLISKMEYVTKGQYVYAKHHNVFVDWCTKALDVLKDLYNLFKSKKDTTLPKVEELISMAETRIGFMRKVKYGDIVLTKDHNLVIDTLKPIELALKEIENNL